MSDDPSKYRLHDSDYVPDQLRVPFIFVPHGAPMPLEWMAAHPGWVKFPATFVPRQPDRNPVFDAPQATRSHASAAHTSTRETRVTDIGGTTATVGRGAAVALTPEFFSALGASVLAAPLAAAAAFGVGLWPKPANRDEAARLKRYREENDHRGPHGGLVPPPPTPALPGLVPPVTAKTRPGEGGFIPPRPSPPLPGFTPAPPQPSVLPGRAIEVQKPTVLYKNRNKGLPPGVTTSSARARRNAKVADPEVTESLADHEWSVHHLHSVGAVRGRPDLHEAAAGAGWKLDSVTNVAALPRTPEAQAKLKARGIDRPLHAGSHSDWSDRDLARTLEIEEKFMDPAKALDEVGAAVRKALEDFEKELREEMLKLETIVEREDGSPIHVA